MIWVEEEEKEQVPQKVPQIHHFSISVDFSNELKLIISSISLEACTIKAHGNGLLKKASWKVMEKIQILQEL